MTYFRHCLSAADDGPYRNYLVYDQTQTNGHYNFYVKLTADQSDRHSLRSDCLEILGLCCLLLPISSIESLSSCSCQVLKLSLQLFRWESNLSWWFLSCSENSSYRLRLDPQLFKHVCSRFKIQLLIAFISILRDVSSSERTLFCSNWVYSYLQAD